MIQRKTGGLIEVEDGGAAVVQRYTRREKRLWGEKNRKGIENYKERVVMEGSCWSWKLVGGGI